MQKEKTLQFWDEYYIQQQQQQQQQERSKLSENTAHNDNNKKEWIIKPTCEELLETIYTCCLSRYVSFLDPLLDCSEPAISTTSNNAYQNNLHSRKSTRVEINILEIGCGNSCFSIVLWEYILKTVKNRIHNVLSKKKKKKKLSNNNQDKTMSEYDLSSISIHVTATDVSPICIQQTKERDKERIQSIDQNFFVGDRSMEHNGSDKGISERIGGSFRYQTLNILDREDIEAHLELFVNKKSYDLILDKGCLDTFLFRSDSTNGNAYPPVLTTLLNNIHVLLSPTRTTGKNSTNNDCNDDNPEMGQHGMYAILSPRKKIKAVRDFQGFSQVERIDLNCDALDVGDLDTARNKETTLNNFVYLHICKKNDQYAIGGDEPFRHPTMMVQNSSQLHHDEEECEKCKTTFYQFRNGEAVTGRGLKYWNRRWIGHCHHCKGSIH